MPVLDRRLDVVELGEVKRVWLEEFGRDDFDLKDVSELDPLPSGQQFSFEAQKPAIAARGLAEAEKELGPRQGRKPRRRGIPAQGRSAPNPEHAAPGRGSRARGGAVGRRARPRVRDRSRAPRVRLARPRARPASPTTPPPHRAPGRDGRPGAAVVRRPAHRDFVVHEDHGVGKLLGFETKTIANVTRDYLFLALHGDDRLYVLHEQIGKVSRYIGADAKAPALSKLGGKATGLAARAKACTSSRAT